MDNQAATTALQNAIAMKVAEGWAVTSQTEISASLIKKKEFSFWRFILPLGFPYLLYYMAMKDETMLIQVSQEGQISITTGRS